MELAKIRNKALQAEAPQPARGVAAPAETDAAAPPGATAEPAPPAPVVPEQGAVSCEPLRLGTPQRRFDPVAVILAGRQAAETAGDDDLLESVHSAETSDESFEEFLCFSLGDEEYGVNIMEIKEIIKPRELTEVPRTPEFVDGVVSLRGVIVPVLAMRRRFAMPSLRDAGQERIVIVRHSDGLTGLRVDRITGVLRIADRCREPAPGVLDGAAREFVAGIGRSDGRMVIILDVASIIDFSFGEVYDHGSRSN